MADKKPRSDFYADKNMIRHMIVISPDGRTKLKDLAKKHRLTQGEVIEVFLDRMDAIDPKYFAERREQHVITKTELVKRMKDLSPDQRKAIEDIILNKK